MSSARRSATVVLRLLGGLAPPLLLLLLRPPAASGEWGVGDPPGTPHPTPQAKPLGSVGGAGPVSTTTGKSADQGR